MLELYIRIEGPAGCGKTQLANFIKEKFSLFKDKDVAIFDELADFPIHYTQEDVKERAKTADVIIQCRQIKWT